jgi:hypothetical protein
MVETDLQRMGKNIRVLECFYYRGQRCEWSDSGDVQTAQEEEIYLFQRLVAKGIKSNPFGLDVFLKNYHK